MISTPNPRLMATHWRIWPSAAPPAGQSAASTAHDAWQAARGARVASVDHLRAVAGRLVTHPEQAWHDAVSAAGIEGPLREQWEALRVVASVLLDAHEGLLDVSLLRRAPEAVTS